MLPEWLARIHALDRFFAELPLRLQEELASTISTGGVMQHDKTRKLSKAEIQRRSGLRSEVYTKRYGRVPAPQFFRNLQWEGKALRCFRSIKEVSEGIAYANGLPKLLEGFKRLREFRKRMEDVHAEHDAAFANLALDWWPAACHWANTAPQPEAIYRIEGRTIVYDDSKEEKIIRIPSRAEVGDSMWPAVRSLWPK